MSYDVEVATHERPVVDGLDGVTVDGPVAAEPDDLAEALAAAVLAPRWLTTLSIPYDASATRREQLRTLGRRVAKEAGGAAFDPQADKVIWPRGKPKRVPAGKAEKTSIVNLEWYVDAGRWSDAPAALLGVLARRCPEALPTRYGVFEPPQGRYDPAAPDAYTALARDDSAFWFASRPFFGGHTSPPERRDSGQIGLDVDWRVLEAGPRWRETVADLFAAAAVALGAFYAEGWVEPGWEVSSNNRLWISAGRKTRGSALGRDGWQGLPAEPAWLTWFGGRHREPVAAALGNRRAAPPPAAPGDHTDRGRAAGGRAGPARRAAARQAPAPPPPAGAAQSGLSRRSRSAVNPG